MGEGAKAGGAAAAAAGGGVGGEGRAGLHWPGGGAGLRAPTHLLAVGARQMAMLSADGQVVASYDMPGAPLAAPAIGDFNCDGVNDVVLFTEKGFYGYTLRARLPLRLFTLGLALLLLLLLVAVGCKLGEDTDGCGGCCDTGQDKQDRRRRARPYRSRGSRMMYSRRDHFD